MPTREPEEGETPEQVEQERIEEQERINNGERLCFIRSDHLTLPSRGIVRGGECREGRTGRRGLP